MKINASVFTETAVKLEDVYHEFLSAFWLIEEEKETEVLHNPVIREKHTQVDKSFCELMDCVNAVANRRPYSSGLQQQTKKQQ
jgi:hypothetical protein